MLGANKLKPKYGKLKDFLPLPASFNRIHRFQKQNFAIIAVLLIFVWIILYPLHGFSGLWSHKASSRYPKGHPLTSPHVIETPSKYIYPPIEHAPLLKELGIHKLVKESKVRDANFLDIEKTVIRSLNIFDDPNPAQQKIKEDEENSLSDLAKAKNYFKNQDKVVFKPKNPKNYPDVIIVTAVDFERYSLDALTKLVQNRVDYAHKQSYGMYVRWYQEFLPILNSLSYLQTKEKAKWVRLYCLRAAMFAFPEAKWFWYLDQDAFIMDLNINLQEYVLSPEALSPIMLREQSIIPPNGAIKTYKNTRAQLVELLITQSNSKVETTSIILKNSNIGRSILEIWGDKLYLNYPNFPYGPDSALTHILQWHPFILSKTSIIPPRTISAKNGEVDPQDKLSENTVYHKGDFVAQWSDCEHTAKCEEQLDKFYAILAESKNK